jgi:hypothetical protein
MSDTSEWQGPALRVLELMRAGRREEAFAYLDGLGNPETARTPLQRLAPGFREVAGVLYWEHRALPEFVALSEAVIRRLEEAVAALTDPEARAHLVPPLGGCHYNLAAFTWPGWDEPGIEVGPEERRTGREAARRCLEIRRAPENDAVPFGYSLAAAFWVNGAHALPGDLPAARDSFRNAAAADQAAGDDDTLSRGYLALAELLEQPADPSAGAAFAAVVAELQARTDENAAFFRDQLLTARRVFAPAGAAS